MSLISNLIDVKIELASPSVVAKEIRTNLPQKGTTIQPYNI